MHYKRVLVLLPPLPAGVGDRGVAGDGGGDEEEEEEEERLLFIRREINKKCRTVYNVR